MGNITNDPQFVSLSTGNFHLSAGSPCIGAGTNMDWMVGASDLDGHPRIIGGRVDLGAYEYTSDATTNGIPFDWLLAHGLATDGTDDRRDSDHDGLNNWQEWIAGTDPTNPMSCLRFQTATSAGACTGVVVRWSSTSGKWYRLDRSTNLLGGAPFGLSLRTNIPATPPQNTETDTTATGRGPYIYRIGVQ